MEDNGTLIAIRQKGSESNFFTFILGFFAVLSFGISIFGFVNPTKEQGLEVLGYVGIFIFLLMILSTVLRVRHVRKNKRVNQYPKEAVILYGDCVRILTNKATKINLADIVNVSGTTLNAQAAIVRVHGTNGTLKIVTKTSVVKVENIANVPTAVSYIKKAISKN